MLETFSGYVVYDLLTLSQNTYFLDTLKFFIYDTINTFTPLSVIIIAIPFIRSCFPPEKTRKIFSDKKEYIGNKLLTFSTYNCAVVPVKIQSKREVLLTTDNYRSCI
jgi:hypothetical protein